MSGTVCLKTNEDPAGKNPLFVPCVPPSDPLTCYFVLQMGGVGDTPPAGLARLKEEGHKQNGRLMHHS